MRSKTLCMIFFYLGQCCPTRGPRACGPPTDFMQPASAG